jgi:choice-of-anchor C domain-containing protein
LVLLPALAATDAHASLVTNGSFEAPGSVCVAGATSLPGWTVGSANIDIINAACSGMGAAAGTWFVDLTGSGGAGAGSIYQTVATTPGQQYVLSFYFGGNPQWQYLGYANDSPFKSMNVLINGNLQGTFGVNTTGFAYGDPGWNLDQLHFIAASSSTQIGFVSLNGSNRTVYGPLLDGVNLEAVPGKPNVVPVPASVWLMLSAVGGLAMFVRRRDRIAHGGDACVWTGRLMWTVGSGMGRRDRLARL